MLRQSRKIFGTGFSRRFPSFTHFNACSFRYVSTSPPVTKIEKIVLDHIKAVGPMPFGSYMNLCLSHPTDGYYMNPANAVFGKRGDFITSPEISQVFGELVAIWLLSQWQNAGSPPSIRLVELGPGRGTLMADIIRVVQQFAKSALKRVHLVETSPSMRALQNDNLLTFSQKGGWDLAWNESIDEIEPSSGDYTMLVAHEFFDALPVSMLERGKQGWLEIMVDAIPDSTEEPAYPRLRRVLSPNPTAASTLLGRSSQRFDQMPEGSRLEVSAASFRIARKIGEILSPGGCALVVDYGGDSPFGDSFRAFKDHQIVDVFDRPGECDLTANVDFGYIKEAMGDLVPTYGPLPQSQFLVSMGLEARVNMLIRSAKTEERAEDIGKAAQRLVDEAGMGKEYKVLGISSSRSEHGVWPFV
ncbi:S-adenosyl-L-methionine-dependent methyltransferase [Armillaria novae-zelandiae]|uniref:Protein arginine methyltransferase NDUFAF7 n=1 Tax=Armillaria novae-zelandiae TaxID=153914 RepID=A0AA39P9Q1_9AGAR|nr:S-adenosyl-L-methionine-dependent methyltransferase [Armillaria novae-zelandiae]